MDRTGTFSYKNSMSGKVQVFQESYRVFVSLRQPLPDGRVPSCHAATPTSAAAALRGVLLVAGRAAAAALYARQARVAALAVEAELRVRVALVAAILTLVLVCREQPRARQNETENGGQSKFGGRWIGLH